MAINTTTVEVVMPAMGDSVSEGTVLEWHKAEGDPVSEDETLVEISTDKVDAEVPAPIAGIVVKVHAAEGDTVHVGSVLAEIAPNGSAPAAAETETEGETETETETETEPEGETEGEAESDGETEVIDVVMPTMGESVSEGVVLEWSKSVGEPIEADETIVEISTDKVDAEVPAPASGTLAEILAEPGATVTVGEVIGRIAAGASRASNGGQRPPEPAGEPRPAGDAPAVETPADSRATPVARRVAAVHGIDLA